MHKIKKKAKAFAVSYATLINIKTNHMEDYKYNIELALNSLL